MESMTNLAKALLEAASAVTGFGSCAEEFDRLTDDQIVALTEAIAACERRLGSYQTHAAGQLARRSRRDLGHSGLAARHGFSTPEKMLQGVAKVTGRQASQLVTLGRLLDDAEAATTLIEGGVTDIGGERIVVPWQAPIALAVAAGTLSVDAGDALRRGLGCPSESVTADQLRAAAERLLVDSSELGADQLFSAARTERDLLDADGIRAREQEQYDRGGIRLFPKPDGMWQLTGQLDPESAATLSTALDPYTSPRRGGPRFTSPDEQERARAITEDPRTTERLALDGLLELVTLGVGLDPQKMHPRQRTQVTIVTVRPDEPSEDAAPDWRSGVLEANGETVSSATVSRVLCEGDSVELELTSDGMPLNLGRRSRLFSHHQREALAVRDGGCLWPGCDRPPSFTEAHHTRQWHRDRGRTDIADGCLLCRFHHLQLHNNGWEIVARVATARVAKAGAAEVGLREAGMEEDGAEEAGVKEARAGARAAGFWLIPPRSVDQAQRPIPLPSKSSLIQNLRQLAGSPLRN